jgi:hypothetical protein
MGKRGKSFWIAYLIFTIIMLGIYRYVPVKDGFIVIVLFPLFYWGIYKSILGRKKKEIQS